jgi:hypothetical protein
VGFADLLGQTVLLGIAAAFTPSLLALQVLIVSGDPWRRRSLAVAVGGGSAFVLVGAMLYLGFAQLPEKHGATPDSFDTWLRVVAGAVLAVAAVVLFRPHPELTKRAETEIHAYVARASSWVFLGVAFALSIKDLSSFVVLAPALHDIAIADINVAEQALLLLVLYAFALSPLLVPPALRLFFGHHVDPFFRWVYRFTMDHQFQLVGTMCLLVGAYLVVSGVSR